MLPLYLALLVSHNELLLEQRMTLLSQLIEFKLSGLNLNYSILFSLH